MRESRFLIISVVTLYNYVTILSRSFTRISGFFSQGERAMAITSIRRDWNGEVDIVRMVTTNTLAEVATTGYLTAQIPNLTAVNSGTWEWQANDMVLVSASDGDAFFTLSANLSSLLLYSTAGNGAVSLPVVSGDFVVFDGTLGALKDAGYSASDPAKTKVVMANGATVAGNIAVFTDTAGTIDDNQANVTNATTTASATPGTIRSLVGAISGSNATMTSGNLVGVRGAVTLVGASGGFLYGTQGKVIASGTMSGSSWSAGLFGQLDISAATVNAGQMAPIWGDYGTTSGTMTDTTGLRGVVMTNTTAAVLNAQDYRYGNATYLLELAGAGGTLNYYAAAGTSAGSAGDAAHCAAQQVIKIEINGVAAYIPVFTQNT